MTRPGQRDFEGSRRLLWLVALALPVGLVATGAAWVLLALIRLFTNLFLFQALTLAQRSPAEHALGLWVVAVPVVGGLLVGLIARFGSDKIRGHGIPEALEAILFHKSRMSPKVAVLKPLSSGIVIGSGGPFGAEGPIIMTGGAIGSLLAQAFHLTASERKALLVAGATAGMTAVFGTPLAAVLLGVELLLFEWRPRSLLPMVAACAVAGFTRPWLMDVGPLFPLHPAPVQPIALLSCVGAGLLAGALAALLSTGLYAVEDAFHRLPLHWMWWPALGGLAVGVGGWLQPRALGVGYDVIGDLLNHRLAIQAALALLAVKAVIWVIALGSGTSGGVLAPVLMIGAGLGLAVSPWLPGGDASLWALVCMAATLTGVLGAPLMAVVFAVELTGDLAALLPLLLACGVAHGFTVLMMRRSIMTERLDRRGRHVWREYGVDPQERTQVDEVMTRAPVSIPADAPLASVRSDWFGSGQRHRAYPVIDEQGRLLGMLDRGGLERAGSSVRSAGALCASESPAAVALPHETCRDVGRRLAVQALERLPVVSDAISRQLIGIVSRSDLVGLARSDHAQDVPRERLLGRPP